MIVDVVVWVGCWLWLGFLGGEGFGLYGVDLDGVFECGSGVVGVEVDFDDFGVVGDGFVYGVV